MERRKRVRRAVGKIGGTDAEKIYVQFSPLLRYLKHPSFTLFIIWPQQRRNGEGEEERGGR